MLQVITPTGDRPEAWALCQRWMSHQDYAGPVIWHVVDDGITPMPMGWTRPHYVLRTYRLSPQTVNTQARNLRFLLDQINPDWPVVIWEDDDYYAPDWLSWVEKLIGQSELIGENQARYYHVGFRRGKQLRNQFHASLCSTVIRGSAIETLKQCCQPEKTYIDMDLWKCHPHHFLFSGNRVVGMKGLPGRPGIGMGHRNDFRGIDDPDGKLLQQWIGHDAKAYDPFAGDKG